MALLNARCIVLRLRILKQHDIFKKTNYIIFDSTLIMILEGKLLLVDNLI